MTVMYCEALAFVAAQLHAANVVQRYKCSEIAQALNETPYFLFFFCNFYYNVFDPFDSLFQKDNTNWNRRDQRLVCYTLIQMHTGIGSPVRREDSDVPREANTALISPT